MPNCITGSIEVYEPSPEMPWNKRRVQHLYNRMGMGASVADIDWALSLSPAEVIDTLVDEAVALPIPDETVFDWIHAPIYDNGINNGRLFDLRRQFFTGLIENGLKYKMVLFWSNHFVIEHSSSVWFATWMYHYLYHLHDNALGDFLEMTKATGLTAAMLRYLSGDKNIASAPNENYARELLELFTMGPGENGDNYTQTDIEEIAKLLTGWEVGRLHNLNGDGTAEPPFAVYPHDRFLSVPQHDWTTKVIMGQTRTPTEQSQDEAYQAYQWLHHQVLFKERDHEIAKFICQKIYRFFINEEVNEDIVQELATTFRTGDWQIAPVLKQLFKSQHFFDAKTIGGNIKSPIEYLCGFIKQSDLEYEVDWFGINVPIPDGGSESYNYWRNTSHRLWLLTQALGQHLLAPVNVAGWPGDKAWITESTLTLRWGYLKGLLTTVSTPEAWFNTANTRAKYRQLAKDLTTSFIERSEDLTVADMNNPAVIAAAIAEHFVIVDLSAGTLDCATMCFKSRYPENYYQDGSWNLDFPDVPYQFIDLMVFLLQLPEYQLN